MKIVVVTPENYRCFADMLFWRRTGRERIPAAADVPPELHNENLWVYAAEEDDRFVGWISLVRIPKVSGWSCGHLYVDELWVAEPYRRRGIARALLDEAERLCRNLCLSGLRLYVNIENPGAQALYKFCGFVPAGTAEFMEKPLR